MKPGPSLKVALATIILGALIALPAVALAVVRGARTIGAPSVATPGITRRQLSRGRWFVFERTGSSSGGGGFTFTQNPPDLEPSQVKVTGPDGAMLAVSAVTVNETLTKSATIYTAAVQFDVPAAGRYTTEIDSSRPGAVVITRSLGDTFRSIVAPLVAAAAGGLLGVLGLVLLIVGSVRRSGANRSPSATPGAWSSPATAGWYPDPESNGALGGQRWWDGSRWTEHRS